MNYVRICKHLNDKGTLVKEHQISDAIDDPTIDWYTSHYYYNEDQYKQFKQSGTIAGITDVKTNKLLFDFDAELKSAKSDTEFLIQRLQDLEITTDSIQISFSGRKGFTVVVETDNLFTPTELKQICYNSIGEGLSSLDPTVYNASRVIRVPCTRHQVSGLYKLPLSVDKFISSSVDDIVRLANDFNNCPQSMEYNVVSFSDQLKNKLLKQSNPKPIKKLDMEGIESLSMSKKPKFLSNCKWALQNGFFKEGLRSNVFTALASTYRGLGYGKEMVYRMLKGVAEEQAAKNNCERFSDIELYNNVVTQVFSNSWQGGIYTCKKEGWLRDYCQSLGDNKCKHVQEEIVDSENVFDMFKKYATDIDSLTVKTGIPALDKKLRMTVGMSVGVLAAPGVGKTSLSLSILNNVSKQGIRSLFFSYDMFHALVYQKLIQKHLKMSETEIFKMFSNPSYSTKIDEIKKVIKEEYSKVSFCFKSGQTIEDIINTIQDTEEKTGEKVKLIVIDYNELVSTDMSDATASSAFVAQKIRQIANELELCAISLYQPSKLTGDPSQEITSYRAAKGSSSIEQSTGIMLALSRPGYSARNPNTDKYLTVSCVKNRMGPLFSLDLHWDGPSGEVRELTDEEEFDLEQMRKDKAMAEEESEKGWK